MNWQVEGKNKDGDPATLTVVGGANDEAGVREALKATHPHVEPSKLTQLDGNLQPVKQAAKRTGTATGHGHAATK